MDAQRNKETWATFNFLISAPITERNSVFTSLSKRPQWKVSVISKKSLIQFGLNSETFNEEIYELLISDEETDEENESNDQQILSRISNEQLMRLCVAKMAHDREIGLRTKQTLNESSTVNTPKTPSTDNTQNSRTKMGKTSSVVSDQTKGKRTKKEEGEDLGESADVFYAFDDYPQTLKDIQMLEQSGITLDAIISVSTLSKTGKSGRTKTTQQNKKKGNVLQSVLTNGTKGISAVEKTMSTNSLADNDLKTTHENKQIITLVDEVRLSKHSNTIFVEVSDSVVEAQTIIHKLHELFTVKCKYLTWLKQFNIVDFPHDLLDSSEHTKGISIIPESIFSPMLFIVSVIKTLERNFSDAVQTEPIQCQKKRLKEYLVAKENTIFPKKTNRFAEHQEKPNFVQIESDYVNHNDTFAYRELNCTDEFKSLLKEEKELWNRMPLPVSQKSDSTPYEKTELVRKLRKQSNTLQSFQSSIDALNAVERALILSKFEAFCSEIKPSDKWNYSDRMYTEALTDDIMRLQYYDSVWFGRKCFSKYDTETESDLIVLMNNFPSNRFEATKWTPQILTKKTFPQWMESEHDPQTSDNNQSRKTTVYDVDDSICDFCETKSTVYLPDGSTVVSVNGKHDDRSRIVLANGNETVTLHAVESLSKVQEKNCIAEAFEETENELSQNEEQATKKQINILSSLSMTTKDITVWIGSENTTEASSLCVVRLSAGEHNVRIDKTGTVVMWRKANIDNNEYSPRYETHRVITKKGLMSRFFNDNTISIIKPNGEMAVIDRTNDTVRFISREGRQALRNKEGEVTELEKLKTTQTTDIESGNVYSTRSDLCLFVFKREQTLKEVHTINLEDSSIINLSENGITVSHSEFPSVSISQNGSINVSLADYQCAINHNNNNEMRVCLARGCVLSLNSNGMIEYHPHTVDVDVRLAARRAIQRTQSTFAHTIDLQHGVFITAQYEKAMWKLFANGRIEFEQTNEEEIKTITVLSDGKKPKKIEESTEGELENTEDQQALKTITNDDVSMIAGVFSAFPEPRTHPPRLFVKKRDEPYVEYLQKKVLNTVVEKSKQDPENFVFVEDVSGDAYAKSITIISKTPERPSLFQMPAILEIPFADIEKETRKRVFVLRTLLCNSDLPSQMKDALLKRESCDEEKDSTKEPIALEDPRSEEEKQLQKQIMLQLAKAETFNRKEFNDELSSKSKIKPETKGFIEQEKYEDAQLRVMREPQNSQKYERKGRTRMTHKDDKGFAVSIDIADFGTVMIGNVYQISVFLTNKTSHTQRYRVTIPTNSQLRVFFSSGPLAPGMSSRIVLELRGLYVSEIEDIFSIVIETQTITIPIKGKVISETEWEITPFHEKTTLKKKGRVVFRDDEEFYR